MRLSLLTLGTVAALVGTGEVAAACLPAIVGGDTAVTITGVAIGAGELAVQTLQIRVANRDETQGGGGRCPAVMRVSRVSPALSADFPLYQLRAPGNLNVEILPEAALGGSPRADVVLANLSKGPNGQAVPFQFRLPTEWGTRAGTFTEQLLFTLYDEAGQEAGRTLVNVSVSIPPAVAVRFAGAVTSGGKVNRIDLGVLSPTREVRSPPFSARIFSTAPYSVSFLSDNRGELWQDGGPGRIPYRLYFDGREVTFGGVPVFSSAAHTGSGGDLRPLLIVVPPKVADAGSYSDSVTIQVSAI